MKKFKKLGISDSILESIQEHEFEKPSEIQKKAIPLILEGKDVIAGSATGSGKTLAFATGIIQKVEQKKGLQALVIVPTRELAEQVSQVLNKFSKYKELKIISVYGGVSINPQITDLRTAEVVIGTPGRLLDHINRKTINLHNIKILVLDEADRMLDMGFIDDVSEIIRNCPNKRQTLLLSATITGDIVHLAKKYTKNAVEVSAEDYVNPAKLKQVYYDVDENIKFSLLMHMLKQEKKGLIMVFCNTRSTVEFVSKNLKFSGVDASGIHGGLSQDKRKRVIEKFHGKNAHVLVCTDVAARGLDIKGVTHIYNYNIPNTGKEYIHRIGRTARAGKEGKVINLLSNKDYDNFRKVLEQDIEIENLKTPYVEKVQIKWMPKKRYRSKSSYRSNRNRNNNRRSDRRGKRNNQNKGNKRYGKKSSKKKNYGKGRSNKNYKRSRNK